MPQMRHWSETCQEKAKPDGRPRYAAISLVLIVIPKSAGFTSIFVLHTIQSLLVVGSSNGRSRYAGFSTITVTL